MLGKLIKLKNDWKTVVFFLSLTLSLASIYLYIAPTNYFAKVNIYSNPIINDSLESITVHQRNSIAEYLIEKRNVLMPQYFVPNAYLRFHQASLKTFFIMVQSYHNWVNFKKTSPIKEAIKDINFSDFTMYSGKAKGDFDVLNIYLKGKNPELLDKVINSYIDYIHNQLKDEIVQKFKAIAESKINANKKELEIIKKIFLEFECKESNNEGCLSLLQQIKGLEENLTLYQTKKELKYYERIDLDFLKIRFYPHESYRQTPNKNLIIFLSFVSGLILAFIYLDIVKKNE